MNKKYFISSPSYGMIDNQECLTRFNDMKLFTAKAYYFTKLIKVKVWYGSPSVTPKSEAPNVVLGIEGDYRLLSKENKIKTRHLAKVSASNVQTKTLEIANNLDYISKLYLCGEDVITYIKFETHKGKFIELGIFDKSTSIEISFNDQKNPHILQTLHGFFDDSGIRALGVRHIDAKRFFFINNMDILCVRYKVKKDKKFKERWENEQNLAKLNDGMKAIIKLCFLPDNPFGSVFKYMMD